MNGNNIYQNNQFNNMYNNQMMNNQYNMNQQYNYQYNGGIKPEEKSSTKWLLVVMIITFIVLGFILSTLSSNEEELVCTLERNSGSISYKYIKEYDFKNDRLRNERITLQFDLGKFYDYQIDDYLKMGNETLKELEEAGYDIKVKKNKPILEFEVYGEGKAMFKRYDITMFTQAPTYDDVKEFDEKEEYVCK